MIRQKKLSYQALAALTLFFLSIIFAVSLVWIAYPYGQATCADLAVTIGETIIHEANLSRSREAKLKETFKDLEKGIRSGDIPLWQAISILIEFQRHNIFIAVHTATLAHNTLQYTSMPPSKRVPLERAYRRVLYGILHQRIAPRRLEPLEYQLTRFAASREGGPRQEEALRSKYYAGHIDRIAEISSRLADEAGIPPLPPTPDWQLTIETAIEEGSKTSTFFGLLQKLFESSESDQLQYVG